MTVATDPISIVLDRLPGHRQSGSGYSARCPAHPDRNASLSISTGRDGRVLLRCHRGCRADDIVRSIGMTMADLFPPKNGNGQHGYVGAAHRPRPSAGRAYPTVEQAVQATARAIPGVTDHHMWMYPGGTYCIARYDTPRGKQIRPYHHAADGWRVGDPAGPLPLYRHDEIPADAETIFVVEGEKCVDLAWSIGLPAVTSSHGSQSARRSDWTSIADRDALIVVMPDHDAAGEAYAADVCRIILGATPGARIKIVRLPDLPDGGDIEEYIDARDSMETEAIAGSIIALADAAPFIGPGEIPSPEPAADDAQPELSAVGAGDLLRDYPTLRPPLIDGVLRLTETANMIDAAKGGKTHTAIDLALAVATGRAWLGRYAIVNPGAVLYIDAELHPNTMARRIASICSARGIFSDEIAGKFDVLSLRGRLKNIFELRVWLAKHAAGGKYRLIVFDALYRLIPEGIDENSNSDMTRVFNAIDQIGEETGAACLIIHHASKGVQAGKSVVDVGSGASAMARATDSHLIFRQHAEDGFKVMEMAGRSWPPLTPVVLRWTYPTWDIDDTLDPTDLRENNRRKRAEPTPDASTPVEPPPEPWTTETFATRYLSSEPKSQRAIIDQAVISGGLSERTASRLCRLAIDQRLAHRWTFADDRRTVFLASVEQEITQTGAQQE
jgi:hypothetical protein